ncbi:MAG: hypothetical protein CMN31_03495 [Sandaracinus sp.]|nr:hypothetical protein [Sandaracinus sp.]
MAGERPAGGAAGTVAIAGRVRVSVASVIDEAAALRFGGWLAEALGCPVWRAPGLAGPGEERPLEALEDAPVVAIGLPLYRRLDADLRVLITGGLPRAAWRPEARGLSAHLELSEPREGLVAPLAALLG